MSEIDQNWYIAVQSKNARFRLAISQSRCENIQTSNHSNLHIREKICNKHPRSTKTLTNIVFPFPHQPPLFDKRTSSKSHTSHRDDDLSVHDILPSAALRRMQQWAWDAVPEPAPCVRAVHVEHGMRDRFLRAWSLFEPEHSWHLTVPRPQPRADSISSTNSCPIVSPSRQPPPPAGWAPPLRPVQQRQPVCGWAYVLRCARGLPWRRARVPPRVQASCAMPALLGPSRPSGWSGWSGRTACCGARLCAVRWPWRLRVWILYVRRVRAAATRRAMPPPGVSPVW